MVKSTRFRLTLSQLLTFFRNYEWGFGYPHHPTGSMGQQGIPSSVAPATADVIAQQSQVRHYRPTNVQSKIVMHGFLL